MVNPVGLYTTPLPQVPVQQPITSAPINPPVVPGIGPIRPVSTQPVPRVTTPSVQGVSPNRYQQGYYMDVGDGYYTYFPPPGVSSFGQSFRRDELPAGAIIAPPGTTRESVWGTFPGAPQFKKTQTYPELQGPGAGAPGGYQVEAFINDQGNILYLTTVGGKVQGGIPPGYRRAGSEELTGVTRRQDPRTTPAVTQRQPQPSPDGGFEPSDTGSIAQASIGFDQTTSTSFDTGLTSGTNAGVNQAVASINALGTISDPISAGTKAGLATLGKTPETAAFTVGKTALGLVSPILGKVVSGLTNISQAQAQPAIAAAQAVAGSQQAQAQGQLANGLGVGNFSLGAVYGTNVFGTTALVTNHPTLSVDQVYSFEAMQHNVNPNSKTFSHLNFITDKNGDVSGYEGPADTFGLSLSAQALGHTGLGPNGFGNAGTVSEAVGYTMDGRTITATGKEVGRGQMASLAAQSALGQTAIALSRGHKTAQEANKANMSKVTAQTIAEYNNMQDDWGKTAAFSFALSFEDDPNDPNYGYGTATTPANTETGAGRAGKTSVTGTKGSLDAMFGTTGKGTTVDPLGPHGTPTAPPSAPPSAPSTPSVTPSVTPAVGPPGRGYSAPPSTPAIGPPGRGYSAEGDMGLGIGPGSAPGDPGGTGVGGADVGGVAGMGLMNRGGLYTKPKSKKNKRSKGLASMY